MQKIYLQLSFNVNSFLKRLLNIMLLLLLIIVSYMANEELFDSSKNNLNCSN